jgi:general stress protein CsbA
MHAVAAILSIAFIASSQYMSNTARIWIQVLLTVTSMLACFGPYWKVTRNRFKRDRIVLERMGKDIAMKP